jgi:hypothetical protein
MGHMVLKLIATMPEAQMLFGAAEMILGGAAEPVVTGWVAAPVPRQLFLPASCLTGNHS